MANSDYEKRGSGTVTPSGKLSDSMSEISQSIVMASWSGGSLPSVGDALMVSGEILKVTSVTAPVYGVARGCADTVPARHALGDKVWRLNSAGSDEREYMATETVGVKVLMRSTGSVMEIKNAPPAGLTFNSRFARPYPPGKVRVNDLSFARPDFVMNDTVDDLVVTWAHRNRLTQGDTLQGHEVDSITPEVGTTYRIKVYRPDGTLVRTVDGITGTTWTYSRSSATADLADNVNDAYLTLETMRDGFASWQKYKITFDLTTTTVGWGNGWGQSFGN